MNKKRTAHIQQTSKPLAKGFSLIELMTSIVLIGIVTMISVPTFSDYQKRGRVTSAYNNLLGGLNYARSIAASQNSAIEVCSKGAGVTCSGANNWQAGWVAARSEVNSTRVGEDTSEYVSIRAFVLDSSGSDADINTISFDSQGIPDVSPVVFIICAADGDQYKTRAFTVNNVGRTQKNHDLDNNGVVNITTSRDAFCP